jgi:Kef-type K+ transport system membrane component KefB
MGMEIEFTNLLIVAAIAFAAPLLLGFAPALRLPAVVLEIVAGIIAGPAVLGWVEVDDPVRVLAILGLAILLFLAGIEIDYDRLRGRLAGVAAAGFALSFAIALLIGVLLAATGVVNDALFLAIVLSATSLGVVVPVLKDSGRSGGSFGQLVIAAASVADFATIILLTLFFSGEAASPASSLILLGGFLAVVAALGLAIVEAERLQQLRSVLSRLRDTTAQIRVRGAFALLVGLTALATNLGLELILGAFLAGSLLKLVDRDSMLADEHLRGKLEAIGFGVFIPVFFVTTGIDYDLGALGDPSTLAQVPIFLAALLAARGLPALLYRRLLSEREVLVAGLLQATSLPFIVAATAIGTSLGAIGDGSAAAFIAAGLLSVVIFPALSLALLGGARTRPTEMAMSAPM